MEEGKGEDESEGTGDRALAVRKSGWCNALVIVMNCYDVLGVVTADAEGDRWGSSSDQKLYLSG